MSLQQMNNGTTLKLAATAFMAGVVSPLHRKLLGTILLAASAAFSGAAAGEETVRVGVLKFGTVNWELDVVATHGLAKKEGIDLQVVPLASKNATSVAIQGGAADVIVTDWIWVSRQRAAGKGYVFFPYSLTVGGLVVDPKANVDSLEDLTGKNIGVAGGSIDKSWLLLRAYGRQELGIDLAEQVEPNFAAPPLLNKLMLRGELDGVLNFWHYAARLKAAGMQELISVSDILPKLGVDQPVPLLGWVFDETWANEHPQAITGLLRASYAAKKLLVESDEEWERLRPNTKAEDDVTLAALRDAYRAGVPRAFGQAERDAAGKVFEVLAKEGGEELVGTDSKLNPNTFWGGFDIPAWSQ